MPRLIRTVLLSTTIAAATASGAAAQQTQFQEQAPGYLNQRGYRAGEGFVRGPVLPVRPVVPEEYGEGQSPEWAATPDDMAIAGREADAYPNPGGRPIEPGVEMSRTPDIQVVVLNLQQMPPVLAGLRDALMQRAQSGRDLRGSELMKYAQLVLNDTRLRLQALERSLAVPEGSNEVKEAYTRLIYAKRMVVQERPKLAAGATDDLLQYVVSLTQEAQQAMQTLNNPTGN